jgi:PAS domain S-box-containing protein
MSRPENDSGRPSARTLLSDQQRWQLFLESLQDHALFSLDPDGLILDWNAGAERLFGYSEAEALGQSFARFYPPEARDRPGQELEQARADGRAASDGWRVRKDGGRFWAAGTTTALRDEAGDLRGFAQVVRDDTPRRRTEESLRTVEERFRLFMENVREYAVFMLDPEGRVVDWNLGAEHLLGYHDGEIVGQPFAVFFPPDAVRAGVPERELKEAAEAGRANDDRWHVRHDGTYFWATGVTTALRDADGSLKGFVKVLRDSTERKHFEEELQRRADALEQADRRKDEFLAMLGHELRNHLAAIFNALHILARASEDPLVSQAQGMLDRQVRQLARLVDDLLDVSRITRGKLQLQKSLVELKAVVSQAVQTARPLLDARRDELVVELPEEPLWLEADQGRLAQVLTNLLHNAAKYSDEGTRVTLTARREGHQCVLRVRDRGVGIAPDLLPRVFDLFTQAERSLDRAQGGLSSRRPGHRSPTGRRARRSCRRRERRYHPGQNPHHRHQPRRGSAGEGPECLPASPPRGQSARRPRPPTRARSPPCP